jgi:hypothetical protein
MSDREELKQIFNYLNTQTEAEVNGKIQALRSVKFDHSITESPNNLELIERRSSFYAWAAGIIECSSVLDVNIGKPARIYEYKLTLTVHCKNLVILSELFRIFRCGVIADYTWVCDTWATQSVLALILKHCQARTEEYIMALDFIQSNGGLNYLMICGDQSQDIHGLRKQIQEFNRKFKP